MAKDSSPNENQEGDAQTQGRRDFLKKMSYVAPVMLTFEIAEDAWASDDDNDSDNNSKKNRKKKKVSPKPSTKKKRRVEDDDD